MQTRDLIVKVSASGSFKRKSSLISLERVAMDSWYDAQASC